jgi:hypothetical protein
MKAGVALSEGEMAFPLSKRSGLSRRFFLKGLTLAQSRILVGLPPLVSMFNSSGTAYAATGARVNTDTPIPNRFVLWFNGNGIPERYWIPTESGPDYEITSCLAPLARLRSDTHVITGLDNPAAAVSSGGTHPASMSGLMTGMPFTGRGAGGPSIDQIIARRIGDETRFRSLQIGVSQESHGKFDQPQYELGGLGPSAASRGASAPAV